MTSIFISYARSTAAQARTVASLLRELGLEVWYDQELPVHRPYSEVLTERLRAANAVVVLWSADAANSLWVRSEADLARIAGTLVQARIDNAPLPLPFDQVQCADLSGWNGDPAAPEWQRVTASVMHLVGARPSFAQADDAERAGTSMRGAREAAPSGRTKPRTSASLPRKRSSLPAEQTSLVGRATELSTLGQLLAEHRLVTLVGAGGCGKTRLAIAAALGAEEAQPDGVTWIELAALSDPGEVVRVVGLALELRPPAGEDTLRSLSTSLSEHRGLIVLDNCEHLIDTCASLVDSLLRAAPGLRVLATSREALGVPGECAWQVRSLQAPPETQLDPDVLAGYDAVQLFVARAAAAAPGFQLTPENAADIARICRRLDGIPLALELAAARAQTLSAQEIEARLASSFRLLTGGSRTALPRQRTLQATLDWSRDLLPELARVLLRRLAVFARDFTLSSAEAVCGVDPLAPEDVTDELARLVQQSMVQVETTGRDGLRFRMLEPLRQYSQELLLASGEAPGLRERHGRHYEHLAAELVDAHREPSASGRQLTRARAEWANFDAALNWCLEIDAARGLRLALHVSELHRFLGGMSSKWLETFLALTPDDAPLRGSALFAAALHTIDPARSAALLEAALPRLQQEGDAAREAICRCTLGRVRSSIGMAHAGETMLRSGLQLAREGQHWEALGWCLLGLDWNSNAYGDSPRDECIGAFRRVQDHIGLGVALHRACLNDALAGNFDANFTRLLDELDVLAHQHDSPLEMALVLSLRGMQREHAGDTAAALELQRQAVALLSNTGFEYMIAMPHRELGRLLVQGGEQEQAEALIQRLLRIARRWDADTVQWHFVLDIVLPMQLWLATQRQRFEHAARLWGAAMQVSRPAGAVAHWAEQVENAACRQRTLDAMGETEWRRLTEAAAGMPLEEIIALASAR